MIPTLTATPQIRRAYDHRLREHGSNTGARALTSRVACVGRDYFGQLGDGETLRFSDDAVTPAGFRSPGRSHRLAD
jgi:hypothetical protein